MRRKDREITDLGKIEEILKKARVVHLGLVDGDKPYVVPLHYGCRLENGKLTLYMHGAREGRKYDLIRANPNVFIEIDTDEALISGGDDACRYGASYGSVMGDGRAVIVEDAAEKIAGLQLLMRTQTGREFPISEEMARSVNVIRVDVGAFTAKSRPAPAPDDAEQDAARKSLLEMDNKELFCALTGDHGVIAQAYVQRAVREYRAAHGKDADLQTMVRTILGD